jgi:hypothetical protein
MQRLCLVLLCTLLGACSTGSVIKGVLSSAVGAGPSASLEVDVGDKEVARGATIGSSTTKQESKIETVKAEKEVKLDQSSKKKDQKTEIGEVKGNVSVQQGPTALNLFLLGAGWPLFVFFLIYALVRSRKNA